MPEKPPFAPIVRWTSVGLAVAAAVLLLINVANTGEDDMSGLAAVVGAIFMAVYLTALATAVLAARFLASSTTMRLVIVLFLPPVLVTAFVVAVQQL